MTGVTGAHWVGIDSGLTVTKAAVFAADGTCLASAAVPSRHELRGEGLVETDPERQWADAAAATRAALGRAGLPGGAVAGVGLTAHGDCVYLVDAAGRPVRPAIPSLDFRGAAIARGWAGSGVARRVFEAIGELPHPHHVHATLRWLADHEPASLAAARWVLFAKDWLRLRLTGTVGTDPTDATAGFLDLRTGWYSDAALAACGLGCLRGKLPPLGASAAVAGTVTAAAAEATGIAEGVPVAYGVHDITAAALGSGLAGTGTALMVAGTYSVNAVVTDSPVPDERWLCREWAVPGRWIHMSTSATSASNLAWFAEHLGPGDGPDGYAAVDREVAAVLDDGTAADALPVFHPFLFGTPADERASASVLGLRPRHRRGHVYRAVLEGIAFSHRTHLETLARCAPVGKVLLAGGATRSELWSQLFADVLGLPVAVARAPEAGALGAAVCAMVATGAYPSLEAAVRATARELRTHAPHPERRAGYEAAYRRWVASVEAAAGLWTALAPPAA